MMKRLKTVIIALKILKIKYFNYLYKMKREDMNKIILINCSFGKIRDDFQMWLNSCKYNNRIDFLVVTDYDLNDKYTVPSNVQILKMDFNSLKVRIAKKLKINIKLDYYYKLCDFKVAYGLIFDDYIKLYEYWGYCDTDLIFGDIYSFIQDKLGKYERLFFHGHFTLYKNNNLNNTIFMSEEYGIDYKKALNDDKIYIIDETHGTYKLYLKKNIKMYTNFDFIDIDKNCKYRYKVCDYLNKDFKIQSFLWKNRKLYHIYVDNNKIKYKEIMYIHYSNRVYSSIQDSNSFFITLNGFIDNRKDLDSINIKDLTKMNRRQNIIREKIEILFNRFFSKIQRKFKKIKRKIRKNE